MATITANQLAVGFFNMAAGGYAAEANLNLAANEYAAANAYIALPSSGLNQPALFGNGIFATALVARLMSGADAALSTSLVKVVTDYMAANPLMGRGAVAVEMIKAVMAISPTDALLAAAAAPFKAKVALADASTSTSKDMSVLGVVVNGAAPVPATTFYFTATAGETLTGTAGNDIFNARILDNSNTAQSGDKIVGGDGTADRMNLDIGNSQNFSITLESTGVEQVAIRAEAVGVDSSNNNINSGSLTKTTPVQIASTIDAQRMEGVTQWESNNSRADVIIEDVRIASGAATKSVTIAMVETDPGNVDMAVYFNQLSLRNSSSGTASINIFLMDTAAATATQGTAAFTPLLNQYFNTYTFYANNQKVVLGGANTAAGDAIDAATTYPALKAAFELALKTANVAGVVTDLTGTVTVGLSGPVNMTAEANKVAESAQVANSFLNLTGEILTITTNNATAISNKSVGQADGGWAASGTAPSTGAIAQTFNSGATTSAELVTSKVILDDVGMGSTGGDLVIGGMSVGETSTSKGVERFEIEVRDNSKLQTINGTNNALREVTIVNGATSNVNGTSATSTTDSAYRTVTKDAGDLTVNGNVNLTSIRPGTIANTSTGTIPNTDSDTILKGVNNANTINGYTADHHGAYGFTDVRLIDASAMTGKLAFTAQITTDSIAKYVTAVDTAANPAGDVANAGNANFNVKGANFAYTGGNNDDTMVVAIDGNVAASNSAVVTGLNDFTFNVNGGAGKDAITVSLVDKAGTPHTAGATSINAGSANNWYENQAINKNITINGGSGDDVIKTPGSGDIKILAGTGDDTVYVDNTGNFATYVFNADAVNGGGRMVTNLQSQPAASVSAVNAGVTVTYKGFSVNADIGESAGKSANVTITDLTINQAIKKAINDDSVLNKLLLAEDGPGRTLVVKSLIDGADVGAADLGLTFTSAPLTTSQTAVGLVLFSAAATATPTLLDGYGGTVFSTNTAASFGTDAMGVNLIGSDSSAVSDNSITPDLGKDVMVLGTGQFSNDIVSYSGFGNGMDTIVNFDSTWYPGGQTAYTGGQREVIQVTFGPSDGSPAAQTIVFAGTTVNLSAPSTQGVIPAIDVAYQFAQAFSSQTGTWYAVNTPGSNVVNMIRVAPGKMDDVVNTDFTGTYMTAAATGGGGSVTVATKQQGADVAVGATSSSFSVKFDTAGSAAAADDSFTFDGATVPYLKGDGSISLTQKLAVAGFTNWNVASNGTDTVTFTAKVAGVRAIGATADFDLGTNTVVGTLTPIAAGTDASTKAPALVTYPAAPSAGLDYLDFSGYALTGTGGIKGGIVVGALDVSKTGTYINLVESLTNVGEYTINLVDLGLTSAVTDNVAPVQIAVADFGVHQNFTAQNFLLNGEAPASLGAYVTPAGQIDLNTLINVVTPLPAALTVAGSDSVDAGLAATTFTLNAGAYAYNIANFGANDKLVGPSGAPVAVFTNANPADGNVDLTFGTVQVHLTGLTPAQDAALTTLDSLNTLFGAGTVAVSTVVTTPTFSVAGAAAALEGAPATYTVTLSAAQTVATTVAYTLAGTGGAVLGTDTGVHAPAGNTGTLTFAAGATTATVVVPFATDAVTPETGEGVSLTLSAPSAGTALSATAATVTTAITNVVPTGGPVPVAAAGTVSAAAGDFTYNVAAGGYTYTIDGFAAGDKLAFFTGAALNIVNDLDQADGIQQYTAADSVGGTTMTITLTGLTAAQDAAFFNTNSLNTVFGAGTLV